MQIVVNNAGIGENQEFLTNSSDSWKTVVDVDLIAVILGTRLAIDEFRRQSTGGVILNTASMAGLGPMPSQPVYSGAKAGV
jgi:15-hydroxyprostaglandin dehydrogenase (NAD)